MVAVDPSVIPLGTRMTVPGYGEGVAADTGGAVKGLIIDLWFPTREQALAWGVRTVTITLHSLRTRRQVVSGHGRGTVSGVRRREGMPRKELEELRVLLVDDHDLFSTGLKNLLAEQGLRVAGEAENGDVALRLVGELAPDVVIMDLNMPGPSGIDTIRQLTAPRRSRGWSSSRSRTTTRDVVNAVMAGACGYLLKDASVDQLVAGIRAAAAGESLISPRIAAKMLQLVRAQGSSPTPPKPSGASSPIARYRF